MGLDMYAYKMKKLKEEEVKKINGVDVDTLDDSILYFSEHDLETDETLIIGILPLMTKVDLTVHYIDVAKMRADNGVPEDAECCGQSYSKDGQSFSYTWKENGERKEKDLKYTYDELKEKYVYTTTLPHYVCHYEEVGYWRKEYDVQEMIHDGIDSPIANCGYYIMPDELLTKLMENGELDISPDNLEDDEKIVYHEWY